MFSQSDSVQVFTISSNFYNIQNTNTCRNVEHKIISISNWVCLERKRSYTVFELYISIDLKFRHMHDHLKSTLYFFVVQTTDLLDDNGVPSFLAYSAPGNVSGNLVYVNYGRQQDYKRLRDYNISLNGSIAMIRYGGIFRGSKVCGVQCLFCSRY